MPTPQQKDYYRALGVPKKASTDEIRKSYRRLARKYHPDLNPGDQSAEQRFKEIQEAYDVLGDKKKRQMYDQFGFYSENASFQNAADQPGGFDFNGFDFTDFHTAGPTGGRASNSSGNWGSFGNLFSQMFQQNRKEPHQSEPQPGEDLEYTVNIGFWDAIRGTKIRLTVFRHEECGACHGAGSVSAGKMICPECGGGGQVNQAVGAMRFSITCPRCVGRGQIQHSCPTCHSDGRIGRKEIVEVRIPPGAQDGSRLRVASKGNAGHSRGSAGDLYIVTKVDPHPVFERNGNEIHVEAPITINEAILGDKIEVPTIDGKTRLKVPPATSSGKIFRLRERGVLNPRTGKRGDQLVKVKIVVPIVSDEHSKELARKFAKLSTEDPRKSLWSPEQDG
ncbi:MAG: molecular chaperone DnaJ [Solibacterales bacterium]|nr:molecular chaperone DnaJ [Bryobacterales bacterium]